MSHNVVEPGVEPGLTGIRPPSAAKHYRIFAAENDIVNLVETRPGK